VNLSADTIKDNWKSVLDDQWSLIAKAKEAKRLSVYADEDTVNHMREYMYEKAKDAPGIRFGLDLTKPVPALRKVFGREYFLTEEQMDKIYESHTDGGLSCKKKD